MGEREVGRGATTGLSETFSTSEGSEWEETDSESQLLLFAEPEPEADPEIEGESGRFLGLRGTLGKLME